MKKNKKSIRGQVVVEYILVIAVIVGIALIAYAALKKKMKPQLITFKSKMEKDSETAGKPTMETYYNKLEIKAK